MIKLSLIIPYYNTYEYTIKLLKELRLQKTDEVEVILIDDGCNEIRFDEFTEFTIIHSEHIGASAAWNVGIRQATGKYIGFIDSDDMIMMNYIDELIDAINKDLADEILFDWVDYDLNQVVVHPTARAIWKAIYRREIVPFFDESWVHHTDIPFQERLRAVPHTQCRLNKPLYVYRSIRENSITWLRMSGELKNPDEQ
jgi:glycosyltransferase involved in cell wall biosynthesis